VSRTGIISSGIIIAGTEDFTSVSGFEHCAFRILSKADEIAFGETCFEFNHISYADVMEEFKKKILRPFLTAIMDGNTCLRSECRFSLKKVCRRMEILRSSLRINRV
jgi:hypothetical protein